MRRNTEVLDRYEVGETCKVSITFDVYDEHVADSLIRDLADQSGVDKFSAKVRVIKSVNYRVTDQSTNVY